MMEPTHAWMIDLDPMSCPGKHCDKLSELLAHGASINLMEALEPSRLPPDTIPPPALIFLRSSTTDDLHEVMRDLRQRWEHVPVFGLFCQSHRTPAAVDAALRTGLDDFICCPFRDVEVLPRIRRILPPSTETPSTAEVAPVEGMLRRAGLIGYSKPFLRVIQQGMRVAHTDVTLVMMGETGTGKELVARAVHYCSTRQGGPFVPVNCGALPDHLVENELFGHVRGAYTDASSPEKGLIAEAEGGTLFLDEVDSLSKSAQVKLLRFLQDREYRPLGSARSQSANVRVLAATNADLWHLVQSKQFREDLYYRINVMALRLPPLRERIEDIAPLALHFLHRYATQYRREVQRFSAEALNKLRAYSWPGNVRELETVVQRSLLLTSSSIIRADDIELPIPYESTGSGEASFREAKLRVIEQFERAYLISLLSAHKGNITQAAKQAGKERRTFARLLQKHQLEGNTFRV